MMNKIMRTEWVVVLSTNKKNFRPYYYLLLFDPQASMIVSKTSKSSSSTGSAWVCQGKILNNQEIAAGTFLCIWKDRTNVIYGHSQH